MRIERYMGETRRYLANGLVVLEDHHGFTVVQPGGDVRADGISLARLVGDCSTLAEAMELAQNGNADR